jgi:hypothetical protein
MTEPLHGTSSAKSSASVRSPRPRLIVPHPPIDEQTIAPFASWMDEQLAQLEDRFKHLMTPHSVAASLRK